MKIRRIIFLICIIINCIVIFNFSGQNATKSSKTSGRVADLIIQIIPTLNQLPIEEKAMIKQEYINPIVRKMAHFSIYALLGIWTILFMFTFKRTFYQRGLTTICFCIFYAATDEFHQLFIEGRGAQLRDVWIDSLGAIIAVLSIILIIRIYRKAKKQEEQIPYDDNLKTLFISSTGGHFNELMQLKPIMEKTNYQIVTEKTKQNQNLKQEYGKKMHFLLYGTKKTKFKYIWILLANCFISLYYYLKYRPHVVITTGTHTAGPMCCIARLLGSKVIYIETFANRESKTSAGRLLYYVANSFIVQWEGMKKLYPKAKFFGSIY